MITNIHQLMYLYQIKNKQKLIKKMIKLKNYLKERGVTQRWLASQLDISSNYMNQLIQGKVTPNLILAYKIEQQTNGEISVYDFLENLVSA